jgi:hypothetical protein
MTMSKGAYNLAAITPSDSTDLPDGVCTAVWVGTGGDIAVRTQPMGGSVILKNVPGGYPLNVEAKRILATGTTATDLVAMYA